jgi:hypothetical protein
MKSEGNKTVLLSFPVSLHKQLKSLAHQHEMTVTGLVRELIMEKLNEQNMERVRQEGTPSTTSKS